MQAGLQAELSAERDHSWRHHCRRPPETSTSHCKPQPRGSNPGQKENIRRCRIGQNTDADSLTSRAGIIEQIPVRIVRRVDRSTQRVRAGNDAVILPADIVLRFRIAVAVRIAACIAAGDLNTKSERIRPAATGGYHCCEVDAPASARDVVELRRDVRRETSGGPETRVSDGASQNCRRTARTRAPGKRSPQRCCRPVGP